MTVRKYSSRSQQTTLLAGITDSATVCTVISATALLGSQTVTAGTTFTVVFDPDTAFEEIVDVTLVTSNTLEITRGIENAGSGQAHAAGAIVRHMATGRDFRDANLHAESSAYYNDGSGTGHALHGITSGEGDVVGTLKTQTLTQKTLTTPTVNGATLSGAVTSTATITGGTVNPTTLQQGGVQAVTTTGTQSLSNKTLASDLSAGGFKITNLATPTNASDAVRKDFADAQVAAAATSATSAAASATAAATSASSASTSASSALTSQTAAASSATAAATSASSASTSQTAAATSATSAAASATAATTSATSAAASATAAATSATSAATSASSALTSATSAAASATSLSDSSIQISFQVFG
jgi:hypothetical protein